jgi:hypothetical protein
MAYYCTRQTGRTDKDGNKEQCSGEIDKTTKKCDICGAKSS